MSPMVFTPGGAPARTISSWKTICSIRLAPRPPYAAGQAIPTQPPRVKPPVPREARVERPVGVEGQLVVRRRPVSAVRG